MRYNIWKTLEHLIELNIKIPIIRDITVSHGSNESFLTTDADIINTRDLFLFVKTYIYNIQNKIELLEEYHKIAEKYKNTKSESTYHEGCRDTFGAGFFTEYDEFKELREIYWRIENEKINR